MTTTGQEQIEAWDGSRRDLSDPNEMAQFMAFLQHNGFPTPLLDWSFSPYVSAYFAFEGVNHFQPSSDEVAIYSFDQQAWAATFNQTYYFDAPDEHVTLLRPTYRGNHKQMLQQGVFWFTNCIDPEGHVRINEKEQKISFLTKYTLSVKERKIAMRDLELMGVTAMQLAPGIESVCKKAFETIATTIDVGPTPSELKSGNVYALSKTMSIVNEAAKVEKALEYINCPECNVKLNPKNLSKHLKRQHAK